MQDQRKMIEVEAIDQQCQDWHSHAQTIQDVDERTLYQQPPPILLLEIEVSIQPNQPKFSMHLLENKPKRFKEQKLLLLLLLNYSLTSIGTANIDL